MLRIAAGNLSTHLPWIPMIFEKGLMFIDFPWVGSLGPALGSSCCKPKICCKMFQVIDMFSICSKKFDAYVAKESRKVLA